MKKKIKDLAKKEYDKICDKYDDCRTCILGVWINRYKIECKVLNLDKYGEQEIEVEDNEESCER